VKLANVLGWSVYYPRGVVYKSARGSTEDVLPVDRCQAVVVFTQGDRDLNQNPRKVYRETLYGFGEDVVEYRLPGMTKTLRASDILDADFEKIRRRTDIDWEF
jgi:hypothetical protein